MTEASGQQPSTGRGKGGRGGGGGGGGGRGGGGGGRSRGGREKGRGGGGSGARHSETNADTNATNNFKTDKSKNENSQPSSSAKNNSGHNPKAKSKPEATAGRGGGKRNRRGRGGGGDREGRGTGRGDQKNDGSEVTTPKGKQQEQSKQKNSRSKDSKQSKGTYHAPPDEEEQQRKEERIKLEEKEAETKRIEEEERVAQEAKKEALKVAQAELNEKYSAALTCISEAIQIGESRKENRRAFSPDELATVWKAFESSKKNLKSDLKKCTAFVKKIKTGGAWSGKPDDLIRDIQTLNLSRYVEEIVAAILDAKLKLNDIPNVLALAKAMHERYETFIPALLKGMWAVISGKAPDETGKLRRLYVRIVTEFILNGLSTDTKQIVKLITEVTGGKDGSYAVTDAHIVVAFVKAGGYEIFGVTPTSIRDSLLIIENEIRRLDEKIQNDGDLAESVFISDEKVEEGKRKVNIIESLLKERAVSDDVSELLLGHCRGAYKTLCKSLVETDTKLQKMEKRYEQDRLLAGSLPEAREKSLQDARKLNDTLQKSTDAVSDTLNLPMPELKVVEDEEETKGIEVLTRTGEEENSKIGPFDDEETRAFYCDVPDFLTTIPPALLGMTQEEIDQRKAENTAKYSSLFGVEATGEDGSSDADDVVMTSEAELDASELDKTAVDVQESSKDDSENKDTPHFKLMVLLEQELPECNRREKLDELSEKFCTNHGSSKNSRKRLVHTLFHVPRTRLDLLPYYSRMAATESRVWPGIGEALVKDLEQQFHGHAKFKKNQILDSRMRTARYIGELTKFRLAPPIVVLRCLRRCLDDFNGANVDVACCLLESCGRYLYRLPHTNPKLNQTMDTMIRLSKAKRLDERSLALISSAMYTVKPPAAGSKKKMKEYSPLEGYIRHLLLIELKPTDDSVQFVSKQLLRCPWFNPSEEVASLICKIMIKACRAGRYQTIQAVAEVVAKVRRQKPELSVLLLDTVIEELRLAIENPVLKDQQRTLTMARLLGELQCANVASVPLITEQLLLFINLGHEIPTELKQASTGLVSCDVDGDEDVTLAFKSISGVTQSIAEDEEMADNELQTTAEIQEEVKPVAVSVSSVYDPRVPSSLDPPSSVFRIKLVCTLLEVAVSTFTTKARISRLGDFLTAFQRYLFTKTSLPAEVEFSLLDTFDLVDSIWRRTLDDSDGFPRFPSWLEAHNATVALEEKEALVEKRQLDRLAALTSDGNANEEVATIASDLLNEDGDMMEDSDEEESDSNDDDSSADVSTVENEDGDEHCEEISNDEEDEETENGSLSREVSDDDDDDDDESDVSDSDSEDEFDEEAHMRQLEDEAFDAELRRLTMDALEKGKVASRNKVADTMVSGSQFIKKKQADGVEPMGQMFALGGMEGIGFQLLKKGHKGKMEAKQFVVPKDVNLAIVATKQDDEAAKEREAIKARVLQYEAESAESEFAGTGGNVYLEQEKMQVIKNRLSMDRIDQNFGTTGGNLVKPSSKKGPSPSNPVLGSASGRGRYAAGRGYGGGRGRGRTSGRGLV